MFETFNIERFSTLEGFEAFQGKGYLLKVFFSPSGHSSTQHMQSSEKCCLHNKLN